MLKISLSLDNIQYNLKPLNEMGAINNRIANAAIYNADLAYVADAVGNRGQSFCPAIFSGGRRKKSNYIKQQLFALDFDSGIPYEEIRKRSVYYGLPIAFSYYTFSSTPEHEKFRVVYLLDCEVTDIRVAETIIAMLRKIFPESDRQCSDASHIFLGSRNSLIEYHDEYVIFTKILEALYNSIKNRCPSNYP